MRDSRVARKMTIRRSRASATQLVVRVRTTIEITCWPKPHERLLDPESETMLTALGLAFLLWQPDPSCIGCGGTDAGGFPVGYGAGHRHRGLAHVWNYCKGDVWGLQA